MNLPQYLGAILAGMLTTLSPCVLPVLPLVIASSLKTGRRGPLFFIAGLLITFVGLTWIISSFGSVFGLDRNLIRNFSAITLILAGILFLSEHAQNILSKLLAPILNIANKQSQHVNKQSIKEPGKGRQMILGALTGIIWTPCSGPSLGVAISLAADQQNTVQALLILFSFGLGAAVPMLAIAYGTAAFTENIRKKSLQWSYRIKKTVGTLVILVGLAILTGIDKSIESKLVRWSPDWLSEITTRF